ncbi:Mur ligase [Haloarchaeobius baliensis]|uniref:Mur ligase n=1 Tax=Haloarchaeobius baliensis TaxID=1670458 RepID=UPI003F88178D
MTALGAATDWLRRLLARGPSHRGRIDDVQTSVVVSGVRGKSSATKYLHDVLASRNYDVYAKVTGNKPKSYRNGEATPIQRDGRVTLYENERELRTHGAEDVAIFENQGISDYTTRVVNQQFAHPDVVLLTNVRQDHRDTLGRTRAHIARSLAWSIPEETKVVIGEQDEALRSFLLRELRADGTVASLVEVPEVHETVPGAEVVYGVDTVLEALGLEPMDPRTREALLDEMRVEWTSVPAGHVFNAASVNDVESTEAIRRSLTDGYFDVVQPLVYLRRDRRARSAAFLDYLTTLADRGDVEQVRVVGANTDVFARKAPFPVVEHDEESESAESVLSTALSDGWPVLVMGNTVASFMRDLEQAIEEMAADDVAAEAAEDPSLEWRSDPVDDRPARDAETGLEGELRP